MKLVNSAQEMKDLSERLRNHENRKIGLVPTMGALHAGHASLISSANAPSSSDRLTQTATSRAVVVSIFVNPKQFNDPADFDNYPSTLNSDLDICRGLGVDYVFLPRVADVYPDGTDDCVAVVPPPSIANQLEGKSRPNHFEGVLTVVCKLFNIVRPHVAYFGEKDYQQMVLVQRMVKDLNMDVHIWPVATVRDFDLLPLSSRNVRLTPDQRRIAPVMCKILLDTKEQLETKLDLRNQEISPDRANLMIDATIIAAMLTSLSVSQQRTNGNILRVDYLELRCSRDLSRVILRTDGDTRHIDCEHSCQKRLSQSRRGSSNIFSTRLLISTIVGSTRLLDNVEVQLMNR